VKYNYDDVMPVYHEVDPQEHFVCVGVGGGGYTGLQFEIVTSQCACVKSEYENFSNCAVLLFS